MGKLLTEYQEDVLFEDYLNNPSESILTISDRWGVGPMVVYRVVTERLSKPKPYFPPEETVLTVVSGFMW